MQEKIAEQVFFISQDSIENALAWERRLRTAIQNIGNVAGYSVDQDATDRLGFSVRKLTFERTYLIHYCIDETAGVVRIVNFRHGVRLPKPGEP